MRRRAALSVVLATLAVAPHRAHADEKIACVAAADVAQQQRSAGRLRQARVSLHICAREVCPAIVKSDCTQWLADVEASVPTIVLRAQDPRGQDLSDVKVQLDGVPIADKIDGLPIEIDPGPHVITGDRAGSKKLRQDIVIHTGDRNRTVALLLEDLLPIVAPPPAEPAPPVRTNTLAWVFAGVAVVAAGTGTFFGVRVLSDRNSLQKSCGAACSDADVDPVRTKQNIADVSFAAALLSAGAATYFFLTPSRPRATTLPSREVRVTPLLGGAGASW